MNSKQKTYLIIALIVCCFFPQVFGIIISLLSGLLALFIVRCS